MRPYKWLRMLANFLRILANFLRSLRLLSNQFAEFLMNPLRMLRILTNALANFANACERLTNETTTQRIRGETPCQCFDVSVIRQAILNIQDCFIRPSSCFIRNGFASIRNVLMAFVCINASKYLRMSYDHYKCLAINNCNCLRKCCENNKNMLS